MDPWIDYSVQNIWTDTPYGFEGQKFSPHSDITYTVINTNEIDYSETGIIMTTLTSPVWSWAFTSEKIKEGGNIIISPNGTVLEVDYVSNDSLFPKIGSVKYVDDEYELHEITDFNALPPPEESIWLTDVRLVDNYYSGSSEQFVTGLLNVVVTGYPPGSTSPATYTGDFNVSVFINLTSTKDEFLEEVHKRYDYHWRE